MLFRGHEQTTVYVFPSHLSQYYAPIHAEANFVAWLFTMRTDHVLRNTHKCPKNRHTDYNTD